MNAQVIDSYTSVEFGERLPNLEDAQRVWQSQIGCNSRTERALICSYLLGTLPLTSHAKQCHAGHSKIHCALQGAPNEKLFREELAAAQVWQRMQTDSRAAATPQRSYILYRKLTARKARTGKVSKTEAGCDTLVKSSE